MRASRWCLVLTALSSACSSYQAMVGEWALMVGFTALTIVGGITSGFVRSVEDSRPKGKV